MSSRAGALLCLLAASSLPAEAAKSKTAVRGSWSSSDADSGWWPFSSESSSQSVFGGAVAAPGEEAFRDEALPFQARAEEPPKKMAKSRSSVQAEVQSEPIATSKVVAQPQARSQAAVVEEYDDTTETATAGVVNALFDDQSAKAAARDTATDGVLNALFDDQSAKAQLKPQQALLEEKSWETLPGTKPDMKDQCLKFARWAKGTGTEGKSLAMLFKSTCAPLAKAGATAKFKKMCEELGPKMEEFAKDKNWIPAQACDVMVKHFRMSGVGANPLE